jgi:hypothetical protein
MSSNLNSTLNYVDELKMGDKFQVSAGPILRRDRWVAGTWVKYVQGDEDFTVEKSDGNTCGFLLYGSENYDDARTSTYRNFTSYQNTGTYSSARGGNIVTLVSGGGRFLFSQYEEFNIDPQGNRTIPATYSLNENLKISENGLLCNDTDVNLNAVGVANPTIVGVCSKIPTEGSEKLGLDIKY